MYHIAGINIKININSDILDDKDVQNDRMTYSIVGQALA